MNNKDQKCKAKDIDKTNTKSLSGSSIKDVQKFYVSYVFVLTSKKTSNHSIKITVN